MRISDWSSDVCSSDLPEAQREHLFALYAFNHEVAKTAEVVSEPMIGRIRLQWWRECLDGIYDGAARQHEVVQPLAEAIAARQLPRALLEAIIDARELDLDAEPPASLEALRGYVEGTSTSRSEEHTSELQSLMRISYAVFCL